MLIDAFGREINYLRISVTSECNLRCLYCRPQECAQVQASAAGLPREEIVTVTRVAAALGIRYVRLTGGEPLMRADLATLVKELSGLPQLEDLTLTTNGQFLAGQARELAAAGLRRVNVSLDSLDADRYRLITTGGSLERTWAGIQAAQQAGLTPVKLNVVMLRGYNENEIPAFAHLARDRGAHVRFIELMPIGPAASEFDDLFYSAAEAIEQLQAEDLYPQGCIGPGPAELWRLGPGTLGMIAAVTNPPCLFCNRLRLTADGRLRPCLMEETEIDLKPALAAARPELAIAEALREAVALKPAQGAHLRGLSPARAEMSQLGG